MHGTITDYGIFFVTTCLGYSTLQVLLVHRTILLSSSYLPYFTLCQYYKIKKKVNLSGLSPMVSSSNLKIAKHRRNNLFSSKVQLSIK
jgi:hypothetical protein